MIEEPNIRSFGVKLIALFEKAALMRSHFLSPMQIADLFRMHDAHVQIEGEGSSSAWIVVVKESRK